MVDNYHRYKNKTTFILILILILIADLLVSVYFFGGFTKDNNTQENSNNTEANLTPTPTLVTDFENYKDTIQKNSTSSSYSLTKPIKVANNFYISKETSDKWQKLLENVPVNPNEVTAQATAGGKTYPLSSGKTYAYKNVTFTWKGARAVEKGTVIKGYYVYFGPKNTEIPFPDLNYYKSVDPKNDGVFTDKNYITFNNVVNGTFNLYVQTVSDSRNENIFYRFGLEKLGGFKTLAATKLFTYVKQ